MGKKMLVVDDSLENRYLLRVLLEGHGYQVTEAHNGAQALRIARADPPDAVVTDLLMPGMDGFELCREWMRDDGLWRIPFVVYTATYTDPRDRQLALDSGAAAYIIKPAEPEALLQAIVEGIERAARRAGARVELSDGAFFERYTSRLREKLEHKIAQVVAAEHALVGYVTRCEAILDTASNAILSIDHDRRIRAWSFAAERLFGYTEPEVLGQPLDMLIPDDRRQEAYRMLDEVRQRARTIRYETQRLHKQGGLVDVQESLSFLGPEIGFVAVLSDLSESRRAAEHTRKLHEQLALAQRLESLGRLAGGVAHDFNNLLTIILSHAEIIDGELQPADPIREDIREIREAGERAAALTRQLLAFSRRQVIHPEVLDLNDTIRSTAKLLQRIIGEDVHLRVSLAPDLGRVEADVPQLEQVLLNLAVNARDAMPDGGELIIETRNTVVDHDKAEAHPPMRPGRFVMLVMTDTGTGMDLETQAHAFDPFFTTKELGKGTGLGLATIYGIVKQSNGFVWVRSEPGSGATFEIYLPRVEGPLSSRTPTVTRADADANAQGQGETILLVEDEDMVRKLVRRILERAGYRVLEAANGDQALRLADESEVCFDLLLTDVVMPDMNGHDLAKRILPSRPTLKVLFTSGYTDDAIAHHGVLGPGVSLLEKPYVAATLTATVRAVLDGQAPGGVGA